MRRRNHGGDHTNGHHPLEQQKDKVASLKSTTPVLVLLCADVHAAKEGMESCSMICSCDSFYLDFMCVATAYLINFCEVSCLCLSYLPPQSLGISPEDLLRSWWETTISILPVATGWESSIQATTTLIPVCHLSLKQTEKIAGSFDCGDTWGCLPTAVLLFHQCSSSPAAHRHRPSRPLVHMLDASPQWYGPFWTCTTLIFVAASIATFVTYLSHKWHKKEWTYDINLVTWSAGLFYGYVTFVPLGLYVILKYFSAPAGLVQLWCLYGYSLFIFIPASLLSIVPIEIFRWVIAGVAGFMSATFVAVNLRAHILNSGKQWFLIVAGIFLLQLGLAVLLKIYFYYNCIGKWCLLY